MPPERTPPSLVSSPGWPPDLAVARGTTGDRRRRRHRSPRNERHHSCARGRRDLVTAASPRAIAASAEGSRVLGRARPGPDRDAAIGGDHHHRRPRQLGARGSVVRPGQPAGERAAPTAVAIAAPAGTIASAHRARDRAGHPSRHRSALLPRTRSTRKNGPPSSVVTTPTGSSRAGCARRCRTPPASRCRSAPTPAPARGDRRRRAQAARAARSARRS